MKEEQRLAQEIDLQTYLNQLIIQDADARLKNINDPENGKVSNSNNETTESTIENTKISLKNEIENKRDTSLTRLNDLFAKVDDRRRVSLTININFL